MKKAKIINRVREDYTNAVSKEWNRLTNFRVGTGVLEYETTLKFIQKYIEKRKNLKILDAGGGPGRYTIALAKNKQRVTLLDYTPALLDKAKKEIKKAKVEKQIDGILDGDIRDLGQFKNNTFDITLCLGGPVSHLMKEKDRIKAVKELKRVTKKNGLIFISVIGLLSAIKECLVSIQKTIPQNIFVEVAKSQDCDGVKAGFTEIHMFFAKELEELAKINRIKILEMVGLEGFSSGLKKKAKHLYKTGSRNAKRNWSKVHYEFCKHPAIVDTSEHMLLIGRK